MASAKKKEAAPIRAVLGRSSNSVKIGIVGMPNVGKSTLFNLLSKQNVPAENFPFCTIDPSKARVPVPDERFDFLCTFKSASETPAYLQIMDIAGLVKGASTGHGLGNEFLSHIGETDAIFHVTRAFKDDEIEHVEGNVDPVRDLAIISQELRLKDLQQLARTIPDLQKQLKANAKDKLKQEEMECMQKCHAMLTAGQDVRSGDWSNKEIELINDCYFLSAKSVVFLVNIAQTDFETQKNKWLLKIKEWVAENSPGSAVIPFSAPFEKAWEAMTPEDRVTCTAEKKLKSMLPKIIKIGYEALNLINFFTFGPKEVRAWTIRKNSKAPEAAGTIHSDFEKGFICADIMGFADFRELGSEAACKAAGKHRQQGREYVMEDGDICFFKFNVTTQKKK